MPCLILFISQMASQCVKSTEVSLGLPSVGANCEDGRSSIGAAFEEPES